MSLDYKNKYLKYKNKYLKLKQIGSGSSVTKTFTLIENLLENIDTNISYGIRKRSKEFISYYEIFDNNDKVVASFDSTDTIFEKNYYYNPKLNIRINEIKGKIITIIYFELSSEEIEKEQSINNIVEDIKKNIEQIKNIKRNIKLNEGKSKEGRFILKQQKLFKELRRVTDTLENMKEKYKEITKREYSNDEDDEDDDEYNDTRLEKMYNEIHGVMKIMNNEQKCEYIKNNYNKIMEKSVICKNEKLFKKFLLLFHPDKYSCDIETKENQTNITKKCVSNVIAKENKGE